MMPVVELGILNARIYGNSLTDTLQETHKFATAFC